MQFRIVSQEFLQLFRSLLVIILINFWQVSPLRQIFSHSDDIRLTGGSGSGLGVGGAGRGILLG